MNVNRSEEVHLMVFTPAGVSVDYWHASEREAQAHERIIRNEMAGFSVIRGGLPQPKVR
jgi:hypothetical protein